MASLGGPHSQGRNCSLWQAERPELHDEMGWCQTCHAWCLDGVIFVGHPRDRLPLLVLG